MYTCHSILTFPDNSMWSHIFNRLASLPFTTNCYPVPFSLLASGFYLVIGRSIMVPLTGCASSATCAFPLLRVFPYGLRSHMGIQRRALPYL